MTHFNINNFLIVSSHSIFRRNAAPFFSDSSRSSAFLLLPQHVTTLAQPCQGMDEPQHAIVPKGLAMAVAPTGWSIERLDVICASTGKALVEIQTGQKTIASSYSKSLNCVAMSPNQRTPCTLKRKLMSELSYAMRVQKNATPKTACMLSIYDEYDVRW